RKSQAASSATRPYVVAFDALRFYGNIYSNDTEPPASSGTSGAYTTLFGAGAPDLFIPADPSVFVAGRDASGGGLFVTSGLVCRHRMDLLALSTDYGFALSRDASGSASPTAALLLCVGASNSPTSSVGHGNSSMPAGVSAPGLNGHVVAP